MVALFSRLLALSSLLLALSSLLLATPICLNCEARQVDTARKYEQNFARPVVLLHSVTKGAGNEGPVPSLAMTAKS